MTEIGKNYVQDISKAISYRISKNSDVSYVQFEKPFNFYVKWHGIKESELILSLDEIFVLCNDVECSDPKYNTIDEIIEDMKYYMGNDYLKVISASLKLNYDIYCIEKF